MQRSASGSYVCWRCLSSGLHPKPSLVRRPFSASSSRSLGALSAHSARTFATVQEPVAESEDHYPSATHPNSIRQRLLRWDAENQAETPKPMALDSSEAGSARNVLTRPRGVDESALARANDDSLAVHQGLDRDGSIDLLPHPAAFKAGDLVEYHDEAFSGLPVIAVCLGYINNCYHFYTTNGKWYPVSAFPTFFVYPNFVTERELKPVIDKLPKGDHSVKTLKEMSALDMGPDRVAGAKLLRKMNQFHQYTDEMLQKYATRFEKAHEVVSEGSDKTSYLTLEQIQQRLVTDVESPPPPHVLYAVHRTVTMDDVGFRLVGKLGNAWLYKVSDREDVTLIQNMQTLVRLFTDIPGRVDTSLASLTKSHLAGSQMGLFILKAREAIDDSRQFRDWTPYGVLGPAKETRPKKAPKWTSVDLSILHFMLLWAGHDNFTLSSRYHWIGSAILRATGKYKESEYLSATTAWTFLQEIGYLTPWDMHERYMEHIPGVKLSRERGFAPFHLGPEGIRPYLTGDVFDGQRHDWGSLKAFAIDSKDTVDVDDAISVEATDAPDEHWVHIHVADPASRIRHQNALAERASLTPLTLYLSGHYSNIWGLKDEVQKLFSLAPGRPCLTFSGLLNEDAELLDYKITPGKVQEFVYMSPEDANTAVGAEETTSIPKERFMVGQASQTQPPNREMTAPSELQPTDLKSLKTLNRLADARHKKRMANGAMPYFAPRAIAKASFDNTSVEHAGPGVMICNGDPAIELSYDDNRSNMVSHIMVLAGEIAAQWSAKRNIPIPYVSEPESEQNRDLLKTYTEEVYYPILNSGREPTADQLSQLRRLVGLDELSTTPARHFLMGVDMYSKVTSPLRRYSDLLSHWQIENALVQEMKTGKIDLAKLPFTRNDLDQDVLPWLRLRQQAIRRLGNTTGTKAYMLQALVRAWQYPESAGDKLPATFRMTIRREGSGSVQSRKKIIFGELDWFGFRSWLLPQGLGRLGLSVADVRQGDVFEVKLVDVNVHLGDVFVEATRKISVQKDGEVD